MLIADGFVQVTVYFADEEDEDKEDVLQTIEEMKFWCEKWHNDYMPVYEDKTTNQLGYVFYVEGTFYPLFKKEFDIWYMSELKEKIRDEKTSE